MVTSSKSQDGVPNGPISRQQRAQSLGVSLDAVELCDESDLIDLHLDTFIPVRLYGYDPNSRHRSRFLGGRFMGHLDLPRAVDGGLSGAMWSITTNPFPTAESRWAIFKDNLDHFQRFVANSNGGITFVRNVAEYRAAQSNGSHGCFLSIQGGNSLEAAPNGPLSVPDDLLLRVTLVHLTPSAFGGTSCPIEKARRSHGLTPAGARFVEQLNEGKVFVDLAHIHEDAFWDAVDVHDSSQPLLVTHTGVDGVSPSWRNLNDRQIKAVAETNGTIGIIFHQGFLKRPKGPTGVEMVVEHIQHVIDVVGDDFVSIGSDYDGMIPPPRGLRSAEQYPCLVQAMLDRHWTPERIQKILGTNFLRTLAQLRPTDTSNP